MGRYCIVIFKQTPKKRLKQSKFTRLGHPPPFYGFFIKPTRLPLTPATPQTNPQQCHKWQSGKSVLLRLC